MVYTVRVITGKESQAVDTEVFISLQGKEDATVRFQLDKEHSLNKHHKHLFKAGQVKKPKSLLPVYKLIHVFRRTSSNLTISQ